MSESNTSDFEVSYESDDDDRGDREASPRDEDVPEAEDLSEGEEVDISSSSSDKGEPAGARGKGPARRGVAQALNPTSMHGGGGDDDDDDDNDDDDDDSDDALHSSSSDSEDSENDEEEIDNAMQERIMEEIEADENEGDSDDDDDDDDSDDDDDDSIERAISKAEHILGSSVRADDDDDDDDDEEERKRKKKKPAKRIPGVRLDGDDLEELSDREREKIQGIYTGKGRRFNKRRKVGRPKHYKERNVSEAALIKQGEANMLYASGQFARAADLLVEVVRIAPSLTDSYHTLAMVHEGLGNRDKAMQFLMIAAHLQPKEHSLWLMVADKCEEMGMDSKAAYCLTKAIKTAPKPEAELYYRRASAFANIGDKKKALRDIDHLSKLLPAKPDLGVLVSLSEVYDKVGDNDRALSTLMDAQPKDRSCPPKLALCISNVFIKQNNFIEALAYAEDCLARNTTTLSVQTRIELQGNAGIATYHMGKREEAEGFFAMVYAEPDVEGAAKTFLKIADAFYTSRDSQSALKFYKKLEGIPDYDRVPLYIKLAECQQATNEIGDAIGNYRRILSIVPRTNLDYLVVSLWLADLLHRNGEREEVLKVLEKLESVDTFKLNEKDSFTQRKIFELYYREASHNLTYERFDRFVQIMLPVLLFAWDSLFCCNQNKLERRKEREDAVKSGTMSKRARPRTKGSRLSLFISQDHLVACTVECLKWLMHLKSMINMERLLAATDLGLKKRLKGSSKNGRDALHFLHAALGVYQGNCKGAASEGEDLVMLKDEGDAQIHQILHCPDYAKLSDELRERLEGHHSALESARAKNPIINLCYGMTFLQYALSLGNETSRTFHVKAAFAHYFDLDAGLTGCNSAVVFNCGRAFHQASHLHFARELYTKALALVQRERGEAEEKEDELEALSLVEKSAKENLAVIYKTTGALELTLEAQEPVMAQ